MLCNADFSGLWGIGDQNDPKYFHSPKTSHELVPFRSYRYLQGTKDKRLVYLLKRNKLALDCYVNADFSGLWGIGDPNDPKYFHSPKASHEIVPFRIYRYFQGTKDKRLVYLFNRDKLALDFYVNADFSGLWGIGDPNDPVLWMSKLQSLIVLSFLESEDTSLNTLMRDF